MAKAKSSKIFFGFYGIAESLGKLGFKGRKRSKNFFKILRCGIGGGFWVFAYEILAGLWNRWLIEVGRERGLYFLQKQKVAKTFLRFCVVESRVDSGFLRDSVGLDSRFCGIVESLVD